MKKHEIKIELVTQFGKNTVEWVGDASEVYPASLQLIGGILKGLNEDQERGDASVFTAGSVTLDGTKYSLTEGYSVVKDKYEKFTAYIERKREPKSSKKANVFEHIFIFDGTASLKVTGTVDDGKLYNIEKKLILKDAEDTVEVPVDWLSPDNMESLARQLREFYTEVAMSNLLARKN